MVLAKVVLMSCAVTVVAKEAADMVLTDDNFATLVVAVEQGRIIYANIVRFIHYLFSCNVSEIMVVFAAIMLGWPLPLVPLQILWLNLVVAAPGRWSQVCSRPSSPTSWRRCPLHLNQSPRLRP